MLDKNLYKKLLSDPKFIPFNNHFDYTHIQGFIKDNKEKFTDIKLVEKALSTVFFNQHYQDLRSNIEEKIKMISLSKNELIELFIILANRDTYLVKDIAEKYIEGKTDYNVNDLINLKVPSVFSELGDLHLQGALEAKHDGLNMILNYLSNKKFDIVYKKSDLSLDALTSCNQIFAYSNFYSVIKYAYDSAIWGDFYINVDTDSSGSVLKIKSNNPEFSILERVGEERLDMNLVSSKFAIKSNYDEKGGFHNTVMQSMRSKRKPKRLKKIEIIKSKLTFNLADGYDNDAISNEMMIFAELATYYNFLGNETLPKISNVTLYDIITVFAEIQSLIAKVYKFKKEESNDFIKTVDLYRISISKAALIEYLIRKITFTKHQIISILDLFVHVDGAFNIYEQPLISLGDNLLPIFLPTIAPNSLRLIDYWLEKGGFDLDSRGKLFEIHIKKTIKQEILKKRFFINIPQNCLFKSKENGQEEIDLIIELKTIIIISEIKCIKFPFEPRDFHNMFNRLKSGGSQIQRKAKFISDNIIEFKEFFVDSSKKIIPLLITNFPIYSGITIDDVPIIDYYLLEHYIIYGYLNKSLVGFDGVKLHKSPNPESIIYYKNEDQFSNYLPSFLKDPIPVREKKSKVILIEKQLTPPGFNPKIIMDFTSIKDSERINYSQHRTNPDCATTV